MTEQEKQIEEKKSFHDELLKMYGKWEEAHHISIVHGGEHPMPQEMRKQYEDEAKLLYEQIMGKVVEEMITTKGDEQTMRDIERCLFFNPRSLVHHMGSHGDKYEFLRELSLRLAKKQTESKMD